MPRLVDSDRVLVRGPSWLGDFVMAEPVVRALHERLREGRLAGLSLCAPERFLALVDGRFEGMRRIPLGEERADLWRGHSLALLLNGSWRSAWHAWRARIPERASWARGGRSLLLTFAARPARERGGVPLGLGRKGRWPRALPRPFGTSCVELAGWIGLSVRERRPLLVPTERGLALARERLDALGLAPVDRFTLVNGARRPGSAKALPAASLAQALVELGRASALPLLVHAAPGEDADARDALEGARAARLLDPPPDLAELVALISLARCYLTPDTGPRHLATAVGTPAVVLFGPTDPRHTADHLEGTRSLRVELACSPCHRERCPLGGDRHHACMRAIPPERVAAAVRETVGA